jgi:hypothetical protein
MSNQMQYMGEEKGMSINLVRPTPLHAWAGKQLHSGLPMQSRRTRRTSRGYGNSGSASIVLPRHADLSLALRSRLPASAQDAILPPPDGYSAADAPE